MRTWVRATFLAMCGKCGREIRAGEPLQQVRCQGYGPTPVERVRVRCTACADGEPPADLPVRVERTFEPIAPGMARLSTASLPLDFKARQMAREPGEDDQ